MGKPVPRRRRMNLTTRSSSATAEGQIGIAPVLWQASVLQLISDAVVAIDTSQRVTFWNAAAEKLYGIPTKDALGKLATELYQLIWATPEDQQRAAGALAQEGTWRGENIHVRRDGGYLTVSSTLTTIPQQNGGGIFAIIHDMTERKRIEEALYSARAEMERNTQVLEQRVAERTVKLLETIADLEAFSYSVSHDLRAPVRQLQGFAELLQTDCSGQLSERGTHYVAGIIATAARMDRLIQDILTLTRVARADTSLEPVDIESLMSSVIQSSSALRPPHAAIETRGPLPLVLGNETLLTQ